MRDIEVVKKAFRYTSAFILQPLMPPFFIPEHKHEKRYKMKLRNYLIAFVLLFTFFTSSAVFAEIIELKNGRALKVEKAWSEGDQIYFIFKGLQAGIPQSKVKRIRSISKDQSAKSDSQINKKIVSNKFRNGSSKDLPAPKIEQSSSASTTSHPKGKAAEQSCDILIDGFCDLKWGVYASSVSGLEKKKTTSGLDEVAEYTRPKDILKIGDARLKSIVYSFWRDRLYTITIWTMDQSNYNALRNRVFEKFGEGRQVQPTSETYLWSNTHTDMMLEYEEKGQLGMLWMRSSNLDRLYKLSILNSHTSYLKWMKTKK